MKNAVAGLVFLLCFSRVTGAEDMGAKKMLLHGGDSGGVPFDHNRHQTVLKVCDICHSLFPGEKGGLQKTQKEGRLKRKQVMNALCINCHREKKKAGEKTGPVTCTRCHSQK